MTPNVPDPVPNDSSSTFGSLSDIAETWQRARDVIETEFPGYALRAEACICAYTAMRTDIVNCPTLVLMGPSGCGKTTPINFLPCKGITVTVDKVTPAAWVANTMGKTEEELKSIDLLPRIKQKLMLTDDAAVMFRGSVDQLKETFKVLVKVLDGGGYSPATATQGIRSYQGDFTFAWVVGTTPIPQRTWDIQAEVGSRLLFYDLAAVVGLSAEKLHEQRKAGGRTYIEKLRICNEVVREVLLKCGFEKRDGQLIPSMRRTTWGQDPDDITLWLVRMGLLLTHGRKQRKSLLGDDEDQGIDDPNRFITLLEGFARGRAILHGRNQLNYSDLTLPLHLMFSSMPGGRLLRAVTNSGPQGMSIADAVTLFNCTDVTAKTRMEKFAERTGLVAWGPPLPSISATRGPSHVLRLATPWQWLYELSHHLSSIS